MIRIVGVQRSESSAREFVLLQNQGGLRVNLKGHLVLGECALKGKDLGDSAHLFADEALIPPGAYVLLSTGIGESRWAKTKDGAYLYYTFMNRETPVWDRCPGELHLLNRQHTYAERKEEAILLR